jgi:hypothetical protein
MLWNSNFFMTLESMKILRILTDVWLPDFKFGPGRDVRCWLPHEHIGQPAIYRSLPGSKCQRVHKAH